LHRLRFESPCFVGKDESQIDKGNQEANGQELTEYPNSLPSPWRQFPIQEIHNKLNSNVSILPSQIGGPRKREPYKAVTAEFNIPGIGGVEEIPGDNPEDHQNEDDREKNERDVFFKDIVNSMPHTHLLDVARKVLRFSRAG
jgi:hypothetical protein